MRLGSAVTVAEIQDPIVVGETLDCLQQDVVQLDSGRLQLRRVEIQLEACLVVYHMARAPGRSLTRLRDGYVAVTTFGPAAEGTVNGIQITSDRVMISPPGVDVEFVVRAHYESVAFLLPKAHFEGQVLRAIEPLGAVFPERVTAHCPVPGVARRFYGFAQRLIKLAARQPALFEAPARRTAVESQLRDELIILLRAPGRLESTARELTRLDYSRIVQAAQKYALGHTAERVRLDDLCAAAGVSERTLQYAFREIMGTSPVSYLSRLRLHRARRCLAAETPDSATVAEIALRWGFWHIGDFGRAYKQCFGETPSQTLRRPTKLA